MCFFRRFIKNSKIGDLKGIFVDELVHLWLRHLNVKNEFMKKIANKTSKSLMKLLLAEKENRTPEERKICMDFIYICRGKNTYLFNNKQTLCKKYLLFNERK